MKRINRRELLGALSALPLLGTSSGACAETTPGKAVQVNPANLLTESDREEYARLKSLDLTDGAAAAKRTSMPLGRIGSLSIGRLISGSNLISLNMHARDLSYVRSLAASYNTEERVFMTLKKCEEHGINTIVLKNHNFQQFRLSEYGREWGGKLQWIADVITTDIDRYEALLEEHLALGARGPTCGAAPATPGFIRSSPGKSSAPSKS